jgi:hypothetical protein
MYYEHPLRIDDLEEIDYDRDSVVDMIERVRKGTLNRNVIIEGHLPLAMSKVHMALETWPSLAYLADDLASEAFLAVVEAVDKLIKTKVDDPYPTAYISTAIVNSLLEYIKSEGTIRIPKSSDVKLYIVGDDAACQLAVNNNTTFDLDNLLEFLCSDDTDREIIRLGRKGYTDKEIGVQLKQDRSWVGKRRRALYQKYCDFTTELNDE